MSRASYYNYNGARMRKLIRLGMYLCTAFAFVTLLIVVSSIHKETGRRAGQLGEEHVLRDDDDDEDVQPRKHHHFHVGRMAIVPTSSGESGEDAEVEQYPIDKYGKTLRLDGKTIQRRDKIKQMMKHAWDNYKRYAWGQNELKPITKQPHTTSVFGSSHLGSTIIDSLDTLYIMEMYTEFNEGRDWINDNFNFNNTRNDVSIFETTIRFIGGMLSCYALTNDAMFKDKAQEVADKLLLAFNTPTGIPYSLINPSTGACRNYVWASSGCSILSEIGTLHLEFSYLSDITGNPIYREKVDKIREMLKGLDKPRGLYPNFINPSTGQWGQIHSSLGALGDSFYEYLMKSWVQDRTDVEARMMYEDAMKAIIENMIKTSPRGLTYVADFKINKVHEEKMDHLSCFSGGLFALSSDMFRSTMSDKYMELAKNLTETCHESYIRSPTNLGPEAFRFSDAAEARALKANEKYYMLRPETIESYFILWRITKDQKYRDWGWEAVEAIEKYCRVEGGYTGISNVYLKESPKDDVQQSYFLAETLKYLYLLYSDHSLLTLNDWVFNTEAHPLPIKGKRYYREFKKAVKS